MVDATNLVTNPAGEATSGTVELRRNAVTNPRAAVDLAGVSPYVSAGIITRLIGQTGLPAGVPGDTVYQVSWAAGAAGPGMKVTAVLPTGTTRVGSLWVKRTSGTGRIFAAFYAQRATPLINPALDTWTRIDVSLQPGDAASTALGFRMEEPAPDAGSMLVVGLLAETSSVVGPYFDGSTSPDPDLTPEWLGTLHASASRLVAPAPVGWDGAYYSATRDRVAALPGGATFTLPTDPGASTLVVETETETLHYPHTGTLITVTEPYFSAAVVPGTYDGPYFDGDTPDVRGDDGFGWVHAWDGAPDASTSTRTYGPFPGIALELVSDPVPSVGVTITGLDTDAPSTLTVERTIPGEGWVQVPGMVGVSVSGGMYDVDYTAPLQVPVTYRLTVDGAVQPENLQAVITVPSDVCWLQDPVNPYTAVSVSTIIGYDGAPYFAADSFTRLMQELPGTVQQVVGAGAPVGMGGTRQAPTVPIHVVTRALADSNRLRTLLTTAYPLMLRTIPPVRHLGPVVFLHASVEERPMWEAAPHDGSREDWVLNAQVVRSPKFHVLVPRWTYGDVAALWETYEQAAAAGGTYLDWVRDPSPAGQTG